MRSRVAQRDMHGQESTSIWLLLFHAYGLCQCQEKTTEEAHAILLRVRTTARSTSHLEHSSFALILPLMAAKLVVDGDSGLFQPLDLSYRSQNRGFIAYPTNASAWALNCAFCSSVRVRTSVPHASAGTAMPVCSASTSALMKVSISVSLAR